MNTAHDPEVKRQLRQWFRARLDEADIHFEQEPLSYDADTAYDRAFHRLQAEARTVWMQRYGEAPTPGQLTQAFFEAEFDRFRSRREAGQPLFARLLRHFR